MEQNKVSRDRSVIHRSMFTLCDGNRITRINHLQELGLVTCRCE